MASPAVSTLTAPPPPPPPSSPPEAQPPLFPRHSHNTHPLLPFLSHCHCLPHLKQLHARALRSLPTAATPQQDLFLYGRLVHHAASAGELDYATRLLRHHPSFLNCPPNSFIWNTLMAAHSRSSDSKHVALLLYLEMLAEGRVPPDKYTFPFVLKACAFLFLLSEGSQIQSHLLKLGLGGDLYINNSLLHFYASCGELEVARRLFDGMPQKSLVTWNVMIDGCVLHGDYDGALQLFREMQRVFDPDGYTLQSAVAACGRLGALSLGIWAHAYVLRRWRGDAAFDLLIDNSLLDMYSKCGSIGMARHLFVRMPKRDVASWNSMIMGFAMNGLVQEAFDALSTMFEMDGLKPNSITFIGILSACNHGGLVDEGRRYFESMVIDFSIEPQMEHYGCMVDLLARAGRIDEALDLVSDMPRKPDVVIWRSLLDACSKGNAGIKLSESVARQAFDAEDGVTSGIYVLLSRIYASAERWNDVGLVRRLMDEEGIMKEPGCSLIEIDGSVHEFLAGDTSHPQSEGIYAMLEVMETRVLRAGYVPDMSQAPMVVEREHGEKRRSLLLHSERLAIAFGLLNRREGVPIRVLKNLRMCRDCHGMIKLVSSAFGVEIIVRDRIRFHHFRDGSCSCSDYW